MSLAQSRDANTGVNDRPVVNWALRDIGKRDLILNIQAMAVTKRLIAQPSPSAHWNGRDALRELTSDKIQERLRRRHP